MASRFQHLQKKGLPALLAKRSSRYLSKLERDCALRNESLGFEWRDKSPGIFPPKPKQQHNRVLNHFKRQRKIQKAMELQPAKQEAYKKYLDSKRTTPLHKMTFMDQHFYHLAVEETKREETQRIQNHALKKKNKKIAKK